MKSIVIALCGLLVAGSVSATSTLYRVYAPGIRPVSQSTTSAPTHTYATLNPSDAGTYVTLSNGNLTDVSYDGSGVRGTIGKSAGKWYYEVTVTSLANGYAPAIGVAGAGNPLNYSWNGPTEYIYYGMFGGELIYGSDVRAAYGGNFSTGDVIGVAVDLDNRQITYYRNGVSLGVAYTSALLAAGTYYPFVTDPDYPPYSTTMTVNFGQNPFAYAPPTGYNAGWYQ